VGVEILPSLRPGRDRDVCCRDQHRGVRGEDWGVSYPIHYGRGAWGAGRGERGVDPKNRSLGVQAGCIGDGLQLTLLRNYHCTANYCGRR